MYEEEEGEMEGERVCARTREREVRRGGGLEEAEWTRDGWTDGQMEAPPSSFSDCLRN